MCANDEEDGDEDVEKTGEESNGLPDDVKGGIVADDKSDWDMTKLLLPIVHQLCDWMPTLVAYA